MAMIKKGGAHGLFKICAQLVGTNGISYGIAGSGLASGSNSTPRVLHYPRESGAPTPDRSTIDFTGGDRWILQYQYGITSLGSFDFSLQDVDADFIAMCTGSSVDQTTNDEWTIYTENHLKAALPQMSLMFIYRVQSFEDSTFGGDYYIHTIVPRCQVSPRGLQGAPSFQSPGTYSYQVTPTSASRMINGPAFDSALGAEDNKLAIYHIISANPLAMATWVADGVSGNIVSAYQPVNTTVGSAGSTKHMVVLFEPDTSTVTEGVADSITQASGTFAVGTAVTPASGDIMTVLHETAYLATTA